MNPFDPKQLLAELFNAAVNAVNPEKCLLPFLPEPPKGKTLVIGAGKAAASMAKVVEQHWTGEIAGLVVARYDHGVRCEKIEVIEAGHPIPDEAGHHAAARMLSIVQNLTKDDLVLCLFSGGGSALLTLPAIGISLKQMQSVNKALIRSGATISEINSVRKHLSKIKGGRLALACAPAQVVTLVISDVPGDDAAMIASGPTFVDDTTCADALAILRSYDIYIPAAIEKYLASGKGETPKPGDGRFSNHRHHIIATAQDALEAAAAVARSAGITPYILSCGIEGQARDAGLMHAAIAKQIAKFDQPFNKPCVILSGGETTVAVRGSGRGGRNAEFLLSLAIALDGAPSIYAISCDTDGIDGTENNAGALLSPDSLKRAVDLGLCPKALLENNDGYSFFSALNDLVITGPTRTNVNDFRAVLIS